MIQFIILIILLVWLIGATYSDIKTKEVPDWLSFSLIIIALISYAILSQMRLFDFRRLEEHIWNISYANMKELKRQLKKLIF